jgi:hypothetical protein
MSFVSCECKFNGTCFCQIFRLLDASLICGNCSHHEDNHAKGYWLNGTFCRVIPPVPYQLLPGQIVAAEKAEIKRDFQPSQDRRNAFKRASSSVPVSGPSSTPQSGPSYRSPIPSSSLPSVKPKPTAVALAVKTPVMPVLLTHVEKLVLMKRKGAVPYLPIDFNRTPDSIFFNIELSLAAILVCIKKSPFSKIMIYGYYIFTVDRRNKKKLISSNFSERNFPETAVQIHGICYEKTVVLCVDILDTDIFIIPQPSGLACMGADMGSDMGSDVGSDSESNAELQVVQKPATRPPLIIDLVDDDSSVEDGGKPAHPTPTMDDFLAIVSVKLERSKSTAGSPSTVPSEIREKSGPSHSSGPSSRDHREELPFPRKLLAVKDTVVHSHRVEKRLRSRSCDDSEQGSEKSK